MKVRQFLKTYPRAGTYLFALSTNRRYTPCHSDGAHSDGAHSDGAHSDGAHSDGAHSDGAHSDSDGARVQV
jgi:hypothetical protein